MYMCVNTPLLPPPLPQRYFVLQGGILRCARNPAQLSKGKLLSCTDLGVAVITCHSTRWRIDIDEERQVYHLKVHSTSSSLSSDSCTPPCLAACASSFSVHFTNVPHFGANITRQYI